MEDYTNIIDNWNQAWENALNLWSVYTRLRKPVFVVSKEDKKKYDVDEESIAFIRLTDMLIVISPERIRALGLENYPLEILSHEIGHHIYCPADLTDQGRLIARVKRGLYNLPEYAPTVANIYSDIMINEKLFRINNLKLDEVYLKLKKGIKEKLWNFNMRIYEILWALPRKFLTEIDITDEMEGDAQLANRIVKSYAKDWLKGSGKFATLCYRYISEENFAASGFNNIFDTKTIGANAKDIPAGLIEIDEEDENLDPADFENKIYNDENGDQKQNNPYEKKTNYREPFEYGQLLKSMGIDLSEEEIISRYYKETALPYLIPFPKKETSISKEPIFEGLESWDIGSAFEEINWFESILKSPFVIPGVTTFSTLYGEDSGQEKSKEPIDLDIYVDSSGSIPDPKRSLSYLTLCGAIVALSALRTGSRVQVTLWSGTNEFYKTEGFIKNENEILKTLAGYFGGSTAFPIHILRDTYSERKESDRKVHILVISDEGVTTMFENDETGNSGIDIAKTALKKCQAGGTFVLNLYNENILKTDKLFLEASNKIGRAHV